MAGDRFPKGWEINRDEECRQTRWMGRGSANEGQRVGRRLNEEEGKMTAAKKMESTLMEETGTGRPVGNPGEMEVGRPGRQG
jgi:hypothetical protein